MPIRPTTPSTPPTKERVISAALAVFGLQGFGVGIRSIAARADAATGLVQYHFGGKNGLRDECDRRVAAVIDHALPTYFGAQGAAKLHGCDRSMLVPYLHYAFRSIGEGTPLANRIVQRLATHVDQLIGSDQDTAIRAQETRAHAIVREALGVTLLDFAIHRPRTAEGAEKFLAEAWNTEFLPLVHTQGAGGSSISI
ncbi:TetR/AcrR family transcriptional regulator [Ruania halotolerans]|uniref:TetR/AcrR family transcriptional regulator n=1 Tax=Ruania halotolerans TaxID=2897773 RepID=UPI001E556EF1|nr:TetR/AcrR family transcriptional regulator [Ruania halotolerans]UFU05505.1 TetR family transcriptional regulator [Ruania halotolerans]